MRKKGGNKKRVVYTRGGSWICAFSWGLGKPLGSSSQVPLPKENALVQEPSPTTKFDDVMCDPLDFVNDFNVV